MCYAQYEVESVFGRCMTCDSRVWSCLQPGLPVRVPHLDNQGVVSLAVPHLDNQGVFGRCMTCVELSTAWSTCTSASPGQSRCGIVGCTVCR